MMTEENFWKIIAESQKCLPDYGQQVEELCEQQAKALKDILCQLPPEEIIAFDNVFFKKLADTYRWDLWGVAYIINGGCSDDGFDYFRSWLIGQGKEAYEKALEDPQSIADLLNGDEDYVECEDLMGAAYDAYKNVVGQEMPYRKIDYPSKPKGEDWEEEDLQKRFSRVCKKFDW